MNYMVMECHPGYAVVLGDDGRFLKVANMRYEVGQTVTNVMEMCPPQPQQPAKTSNRRWIAALAAMAACLALIVTSVLFTGKTPYASVYMTINPEVRIDVNRNDVVVDVEGMNTDGTELLRGYDHRKKDLDTVMDELVDLAIDMGYLHEGGKVTLTLDARDEEWVVSRSEELSTHLTEHLTDKISVIIDVERKATESTQPSGIVIPVGPDSYQDSDYGEITQTTTVPTETTAAPTQTTVPPATEDSGYDDGQTDYDDKSDDDGDTPYGEPSDGDEDTSCEAPSDGDGDTHYEEPSEDDGETDYDDRSNEEDTDYDD